MLNEMSIKAFVLYRIVRLFPLAILMTVIFHFRFDSTLELISNLFLITVLIPGYTWFPGGWSINYEWLFSFIIILFFKFRFFQLKVYFTIFIIIVLSYDKYVMEFPDTINPNWVELFKFITNIAFLYFGAMVRWGKFNFSLKSYLWLIPLILLMLAYKPFLAASNSTWLVSTYLLVLTAFSLKSSKFLNTKLIISSIHFFGTRTYGLFCSHFIAMIFLQNIVLGDESLISTLSILIGDFNAKLVYFILTLLLSCIGAQLSYILIERPQIRFIRRFISRNEL
jgi:peptidoglycan/LPS O-acetylase OafA/YrhL